MNPDRRDFLRTSLLLAGSTALWSARRALGQPDTGETVLVLGAGIAGLAAAQDLQSRGFRVIVVEGRLRVGGRIWTDRTFGPPIELGACWFEDSRRGPLAKIARDLNLDTRDVDFSAVDLFDGRGNLLRTLETTRLLGVFRTTVERAARLASQGGGGLSAREALDRLITQTGRQSLSPFDRAVVEWAIHASIRATAREPERMAALELPGLVPESDALAVTGGLDQIARSLVRGLDVRPGETVTAIRWSSSRVEASTESGATYSATRAVIAVPLGVLKSGAITFDPALPETKQRAIERLETTLVDRIALRFPSRFWPANRDFFGQLSERPDAFPIFRDEHEATGVPILSAWVGGDFARELETLPDDAVSDRLVAVLERLFGSDISRPLALLRSRWEADPLARGSGSQIGVTGSETDHGALAEQVSGRLFFAGEATHPEAPGTLTGAYLSGLREALKIVVWANSGR